MPSPTPKQKPAFSTSCARKTELERRLRNLAETAARSGPSDFLVEQIAADEAELRQIAADVLAGGAGSLRTNLDGLRKFVLSKLADVCNLLLADIPRARAELARHVDRIVMRPDGRGAARHYVASGQWDFVGTRLETGQAPGLLDRGACMVAGAGFEPATSGL